jgi:hypothetical protein
VVVGIAHDVDRCQYGFSVGEVRSIIVKRESGRERRRGVRKKEVVSHQTIYSDWWGGPWSRFEGCCWLNRQRSHCAD